MADNIRDRTCRQCGVIFPGGPRAWFCPDCRLERRRESTLRYHRKDKADRPLGSTDQCTVCGADYIVKSARQKYCPACAPEAIRKIANQQSIDWNQSHKNTYYPARNAKRNAERNALTLWKEREYHKNNPQIAQRKHEMAKLRRIPEVETAQRNADDTVSVTVCGAALYFRDSADAVDRLPHMLAEPIGSRRPREDLTGGVYGRLTVLSLWPFYLRSGKSKFFGWLCRCECGHLVVNSANKLQSGNSRSCGCLISDANQTAEHGENVHEGRYQNRKLDNPMYGITIDRKRTRKNTTTVRYKVHFCIKRKYYYCGYYPTLEQAQAARDGFLALTDTAEQTGDTSELEAYVNLCRKHKKPRM